MLLRTRLSASVMAFAALLSVAGTTGASAQGLFDFLFAPRRQLPPQTSAYANPLDTITGEPRVNGSGGAQYSSYCVRTCDGRFFPVQKNGGSTAVEVCNSFCPAAKTKVFSGAGIENAVATDGQRYASLNTAFAYREKFVEGCTCNGKNVGLSQIAPQNDPTLKPGDIVATGEGFVSYTGARRGSAAAFTPIGRSSGLSGDMMRKLAATKIRPNGAEIEAGDQGPQADVADKASKAADKSAKPTDTSAKKLDKRAQLSR